MPDAEGRGQSPWDCFEQGHVPLPSGTCLNCGTDLKPAWAVVQRDQCRGSDLCCVNCGQPLDGTHKTLRHAMAKAYTAHRRAKEVPNV